MKGAKKKINEGNDWGILRNPSPYRIGRDPGYADNADDRLKQTYLMRRAEEMNNFYEKKQLKAQLDKLEPMLVDVYQRLIQIQTFIIQQENDPLLTNKDRKTMDSMIADISNFSNDLIQKCIKRLDTLANDKPNRTQL